MASLGEQQNFPQTEFQVNPSSLRGQEISRDVGNELYPLILLF